ncbi:MAG: SWIM zinc finger family protein [Lachnospiraceae bacterium]|nr:SWIM zinc finger family protein [Lachnospiraceae bacterium]
MSEMIKYFQTIDDDYLVGLSNKGIVKRSYKDLESVAVDIDETDKCINVSMEDVSCKLYMPLGDSKCSCPSRSMCKHIVMGAIAVKRKYESGEIGDVDEPYGSQPGIEGADELLVDLTEATERVSSSVGDGTKPGQEAQQVIGIKSSQERSFSELESYTLEQIKKQLGASTFRKVCQRMRVAEAPNITVTSVVTVSFGDTDTIVKLLEPLAYSTCSCHMKELCSHKAEAIISYQLHKGILTKDKLDSYYEGTDNPGLDIDEIKELIVSMKQLLGEVIFTGLARISPDMSDSCERMAIMCHNGRLANFESDFRRLSERLNKYFKRHASSDVVALMHFVCEMYGNTIKLENIVENMSKEMSDPVPDNRVKHDIDKTVKTNKEQAVNVDRLQQIAGKLRSEYELSKPLSLMGMGMRHFVSQAGFEGETVYFIEEDSGEWYTFTNARPTIYDNRGARGLNANSPAPWGLNCSLDTLSEHRIKLTNGKVSVENRLSSTSEAVAELIGNRDLNHEMLESHIYSDFGQLFSELFGDHWFENEDENREKNHLAVVRPAAVLEADFDNIRQAFYMRLVDGDGQSLFIKMTYSKEDKYIINHLERLHRRIKEGRRGVPDFFGRLYIEDGELRLYPIEYYDREEEVL